MAHKGFPVGKTQAMVLNALGLNADSFQAADALFAEYGLTVSSKRVGRSVEPEIRLLPHTGGSRNEYGEGDSWANSYKPIDLAPVEKWIVKEA